MTTHNPNKAKASATPAQPSKSKLTYARLITSLSKTLDKVYEQYPKPTATDVERVKAIKAVIQDAIKTATVQDSLEDEDTDISPGKLKHDVAEKIQDVHKRFDAATKIIMFATEASRNKSALEVYMSEESNDGDAEASSSNAPAQSNSDTNGDSESLISPGMHDAAEILQSFREQKPAANTKRAPKKAASTFTEQKPAPKTAPTKLSAVKTTIIKKAPTITRPTPTPISTIHTNHAGPFTNTRSSASKTTTGKRKQRDTDDDPAAINILATSPKRARFGGYLPVPAIDKSMSAEQIFFLGVEWGLTNYVNQHRRQFFNLTELFMQGSDFRSYAAEELGLDTARE